MKKPTTKRDDFTMKQLAKESLGDELLPDFDPTPLIGMTAKEATEYLEGYGYKDFIVDDHELLLYDELGREIFISTEAHESD